MSTIFILFFILFFIPSFFLAEAGARNDIGLKRGLLHYWVYQKYIVGGKSGEGAQRVKKR